MTHCTCIHYPHCSKCHKAIESHIHIAVKYALCAECAAQHEEEEQRKMHAQLRAIEADQEGYGDAYLDVRVILNRSCDYDND